MSAPTVVCAFSDLAPGSATRFDVGGVPVAVVRIGDDVYAIGDVCSHGAISLSEGEVLCKEKEIECWKHGSAFSLVTGEPHTLPATQPVPVYVARVVDGNVEIVVDQIVVDQNAVDQNVVDQIVVDQNVVEVAQ